MNDSQTVWMPAGPDLSPEQAAALSVPSLEKPAPDQYPQLLADKLQRLVDSDPEEARRALEMSQEQAPELYLIAEEVPPDQWGQALTSSESMQSLSNRVEWSLPGTTQPPQPQSLREILEQLP